MASIIWRSVWQSCVLATKKHVWSTAVHKFGQLSKNSLFGTNPLFITAHQEKLQECSCRLQIVTKNPRDETCFQMCHFQVFTLTWEANSRKNYSPVRAWKWTQEQFWPQPNILERQENVQNSAILAETVKLPTQQKTREAKQEVQTLWSKRCVKRRQRWSKEMACSERREKEKYCFTWNKFWSVEKRDIFLLYTSYKLLICNDPRLKLNSNNGRI